MSAQFSRGNELQGYYHKDISYCLFHSQSVKKAEVKTAEVKMTEAKTATSFRTIGYKLVSFFTVKKWPLR